MPEENEHPEHGHSGSGSGGERKEILPATNEQVEAIVDAAEKIADKGERIEIHRVEYAKEIGVWAQIIEKTGAVEGEEKLPDDLNKGIALITDEGISWVRLEGGKFVVAVEKPLDPQEEDDEFAEIDATIKTQLSKVQAEAMFDVIELLKKGELRDALVELEDVMSGKTSDVEVADEEMNQQLLIALEDLCNTGQKTVIKRNQISSGGSFEDEQYGYLDITITDLEPADSVYERVVVKDTQVDSEESRQVETTFTQNSDGKASYREEVTVFGEGDTDEEKVANLLAQFKNRKAMREAEDALGLTEMTHEQAEKMLNLLRSA